MAANRMSQVDVPTRIQQAALAHQLGMPAKMYGATLAGDLVLIIVGLTASGLLGYDFAENGMTELGILALIGGFLAALLAVYGGMRALRHVAQRVYLFQEGMVVQNKGQIQTFSWSQITDVREGITYPKNSTQAPHSTTYRVRRVDGYQITLDYDTKDILELGQAIKQGVIREMLPQVLSSLQAGQTLLFSPFSVHQQGIGNGHEWISWGQVEAAVQERGQLWVQKMGQAMHWGLCTVWRMPNYFVFMALVEYMMRQARRQ